MPAKSRPFVLPRLPVGQWQGQLERFNEADDLDLCGGGERLGDVPTIERSAEAVVSRALRGHERMFAHLEHTLRSFAVLPAWATVVLALGTAAVSAVATLAGVWLQHGLSSGEGKRRQEAEHKREGRELAVDLSMMVREAEHLRYVFNTTQAMLEGLIERRRTLTEIEGRLLVWAAEDQDHAMPARCRDLVVAVDRSLTATAWLVSDILRKPPPDKELIDRAKAEHLEASTLAAKFLDGLGGN
jgi:hypothetical protein